MITGTALQDLEAALAALGSRRHPFKVVAANYRDACAAEGDHRMAAVWQALAVAVAEIEDDERAVLAALEAPHVIAEIEPEHGEVDQ